MTTLFLADFSVIRPDPGLLFWTLLIFILVWGILGRAAFGPIQRALKKRENNIQDSLEEAKRAREEMSKLNDDSQRLLAEAREERARMLQDAERERARIVAEARDEAKAEARKVAANAKRDIENMRQAAIVDLKNQAGKLSVDVAEKILRKELSSGPAQAQFAQQLVDEFKLN
jgi:F-type H+-transporting ATPase subunit b